MTYYESTIQNIYTYILIFLFGWNQFIVYIIIIIIIVLWLANEF